LPFSTPRRALTAYNECKTYFTDLTDIKREELSNNKSEKSTIDLLAPMIKASQNLDQDSYLTSSEIMGNSFIFLFAGHETSANSIHYILLFLAMTLMDQQLLQKDIDSILGCLPPEKWDYHTHMPRLFNSRVGAAMMEQMRLVPAVCNIPKVVNGDQCVKIDGKDVVIPHGVFVHLNVVGVNRNPRYWPKVRSNISRKGNDMDDFVPGRWLFPQAEKAQLAENFDDGFSAPTKFSAVLQGPEKGAFLSFSSGPRACPGQRFAQVEILAVIAAVFQKYSVELDVREWSSDEEVEGMEGEERAAIYAKAREIARGKVRGSVMGLTLQLRRGDRVGLRFVERGKERFTVYSRTCL
jgi:cytochrome P450